MEHQSILKTVCSLFVALLCLPVTLIADTQHLLPKPQVVIETDSGSFEMGRVVSIVYGDDVEQCPLLEEFFTTNGCSLGEGGAMVSVTMVDAIDGAYDYELYGYDNEAYALQVSQDEIVITAVTNLGVIRAAQTLVQLLEGATAVESVGIIDWPAFKLRGYMHDVGRSFIPTDELVKQVELFSRFKVNTFHWHLTENQAWRFEVKAFPQLTESKNMSRFPGEYYTQEDCKRVMAAAKKHGVVVIPEIDMPGHSEAFKKAMGFDMQSDKGKDALKKVLDEVVEVFADAPYIHIGGDEVATTAQYLNEMVAYVESKGKKAGIWNPINGIGQDNLNASLAQMWGTRGYVAQGKANIDCRYNYTNHFDVFADLIGIYKSNIYYESKGSATVAGTISACWNDRKVETPTDIMAQNNIYANVIATAERAWMGGGERYIDNCTNGGFNGGGGVMLPNSGDEYEAFKNWEERFLFHKANSLKGEPIPYVKQTNVRWRITDAFPNDGDAAKVFPPEEVMNDKELQPDTYTYNGVTYHTGMATGAGIYLAHTWGSSIINAYYSNPQFNHTAYAWTYVYSPETQTVGAQIEFQNYSRSEQDGAAPEGKWDHFGSKIWINGEEIAPPKWDNTGVSINSKEVLLKNENFPGREPIEVTLKKGWNKVFIKLPYMNTGYRLKKWMFTCVFTDTEGVNAVEGLIYSPSQSMDEAREQLVDKLEEIKRNQSSHPLGTEVGTWPEDVAKSLEDMLKEVEKTLNDVMTPEQRAAQVKALNEAWKAYTMNMPEEGRYYRMYTPLRGNRYPTSEGAGTELKGVTDPNDRATWRFVPRVDGTYDIINAVDGCYISPASSNNSALTAVAEVPEGGWLLKPAATPGRVIIVSPYNNAQFNQTNSGQGFKVYNWGGGSNVSDDGCQYQFEEVDYLPDENPARDEPLVQDENYYIYAATYKDGRFVRRYLYNNNGALTLNTALQKNTDSYIWTAAIGDDGKYSLKNKAGKYLGHKGMSDNEHLFTVEASTHHMGVTLHTEGANYFVVHNADGAFDQSSVTYDQKAEAFCTDFVFVPVGFEQVEHKTIKNIEEFSNGDVYTFVAERGWMGAVVGSNNVISTAKAAHGVTGEADNAMFQWMVYESSNGNYYLYNLGKRMFMGVQSSNNASIPFVLRPAGKQLTFKQSGLANYPIMLSTDNAGVANHNGSFGDGFITWAGGWDELTDAGSNHKVTLVGTLSGATAKRLSDLIEAYDKQLYVTAEVEGLTEDIPNTRLGSVRAKNSGGSLMTKLKCDMGMVVVDYDGSKTSIIDFTREYRGFEFQGFSLGKQVLGKKFRLTEEMRNSITAENPLVAKFTTTNDVTLFYDDDPFSYRIPAIGKTSTGRLIAVSDYRYSLDDIGRYNFGTANPGIDLVMRYSDDNGKTWSETKTIAKGSCVRGTDDCAYGDAAIAVVGQKVLVMGAAGDVMFGNGSATAHNRAVRIFSEDNGETWTKQDISETLFLGDDATIKNGYSSFFGSGRLAVDENYNGTGKARIYGALLLKKASGTGNYVIYTDDLGLTWHILGGSQDPIANQDEPKVEILPSGQILLSVRRGGGRQFNVFTYTDKATNAGNWDSNVNGCGNGGSNTCNGEPYLIDAKKADGTAVKLLLQSQPKGGSGLYDRRDVTIWYKEVDNTNYTSEQIAANWIEGLQVSDQQSAYSAMALQDDGKIAFFFEEAPCFGDDQAKGYCMVYVPLTISEITGGTYLSEQEYSNVDELVVEKQTVVIYNLMGRKVTTMLPGNIYIVNGKKIVKTR